MIEGFRADQGGVGEGKDNSNTPDPKGPVDRMTMNAEPEHQIPNAERRATSTKDDDEPDDRDDNEKSMTTDRPNN